MRFSNRKMHRPDVTFLFLWTVNFTASKQATPLNGVPRCLGPFAPPGSIAVGRTSSEVQHTAVVLPRKSSVGSCSAADKNGGGGREPAE